ncbi:MAG: tRNA pseudouridine(55) synthase TruB [Gammaproteobacteria bacterium]|nr:MAG: tRNA pseudouridine(55) synthase TruB [Gammaproteobacteria bacterium]
MGRRRRHGRDLTGIVLLDKPVGIGSTEVLQRVKNLFQARKAGHTGSLDRLASGLLPLCFGEATKISGFLLDADKRYRSTFRLGVVTSTGDAEGEVLERHQPPSLDDRKILRVLAEFNGEIEQVPPMHSAIKYQGQRLYKLAHQGLTVERQPRPVTIHRLELLGHGDGRLQVEVDCSKGTYIRVLAEDIGKRLGCGASVETLHRLGAGPFDARDMVAFAELEQRAERGLACLDEVLLPIEAAVAHWPGVSLPDAVAYYLRRGQPVLVPHAPTEGWVRIFAPGNRFVGVGEVLDDGRVAPRRLMNAG